MLNRPTFGGHIILGQPHFYLFILILKDVTGLAIQSLADIDQSRKSDGLGLACLEDGQISG